MEDKTAVQSQMFANRLSKRFRHLKKWAQRTGAGAFRLYDRDIPEIPLVLDFYGNCTQIQNAALSGALYKRPYEKDDNDENAWLSLMKQSAAVALGIKPENVFLKQRQKQKGLLQYEKMGDERFTQIVNEGGLFFKVNLSDYLDTGLFIDRRLLRAIVRAESAGKKVLNLFSYTGAFSVYAAAGGAASTDSVDLSNTYLNWAKENFLLNGFKIGGAHKLIRADALEYIDKAVKERMRWDIIVADPPAFSNSKKMPDSFDLNRDLTDLLVKCLALLAPEGKIFASVNLRCGVPEARELEASLLENQTQKDLQVIDLDNKIIDEDFKNRKIPKAFLIMR
ncbi:MAG: class I SAM-dependent methyltransferase [Treponema sp.]|nr:class I SAM-dependent methyltransferase [Treponema sp.]